MEITFTKEAKELLEKRGLKEADVKAVIENAEANKDKIYNGAKFIAKKEIGDLTVYADYTKSGDKITVNSAYSHRMKILDIVLQTDETEWKYCKNGATCYKGHTDLTYLGATRSGPSLVEPTSGQSWFEEYLAAGALTAAEGLFAQKRA